MSSPLILFFLVLDIIFFLFPQKKKKKNIHPPLNVNMLSTWFWLRSSLSFVIRSSLYFVSCLILCTIKNNTIIPNSVSKFSDLVELMMAHKQHCWDCVEFMQSGCKDCHMKWLSGLMIDAYHTLLIIKNTNRIKGCAPSLATRNLAGVEKTIKFSWHHLDISMWMICLWLKLKGLL